MKGSNHFQMTLFPLIQSIFNIEGSNSLHLFLESIIFRQPFRLDYACMLSCLRQCNGLKYSLAKGCFGSPALDLE
jgi:hypothetical protein